MVYLDQENCFEYGEFERTTENPAGNIMPVTEQATKAKANVRASNINVSSNRS